MWLNYRFIRHCYSPLLGDYCVKLLPPQYRIVLSDMSITTSTELTDDQQLFALFKEANGISVFVCQIAYLLCKMLTGWQVCIIQCGEKWILKTLS